MLTVVLDTNVLVSSVLMTAGVPARVFRAWTENRYLLVTSELQLAELASTFGYPRLRRKYQIPDTLVDELLADLRRDAIMVAGAVDTGVPVRDPKDAFFLSMAAESGADFIVSGDKDLLVLESFRNTRIVTPRQFLDILQ